MDSITHVIFDLGLTIVSMEIIEVLTKFAKQYDKEVSNEFIAFIPNSPSIDQIFNRFFDSIDFTDNEVVRSEEKKQLVEEVNRRGVSLVPGVDKLIKHLHKHNIFMAIATNVMQKDVQMVSKSLGTYFEDHFSHVVCGGEDMDVKHNKPDPEVYMVCMNRFATKPKSLANILIIEDSLTGITGAVASGMKTLLINDRKYCEFKDIAEKITLICGTFDEFRPESLGLPPYE